MPDSEHYKRDLEKLLSEAENAHRVKRDRAIRELTKPQRRSFESFKGTYIKGGLSTEAAEEAALKTIKSIISEGDLIL